jgi:hypothetical protein
MPFEIRSEGGIVRISLAGKLTNAELVALAVATAKAESATDHVPHRITDLSAIEEMQINFQGVATVARERMHRQYPNSYKSALVAPDVVHFGFARMFIMLVDNAQIHLAIFPTQARALEWILTPGFDLPDEEWAPVPGSRV